MPAREGITLLNDKVQYIRTQPPYNVFGWLFATATKSKGDTDGQ